MPALRDVPLENLLQTEMAVSVKDFGAKGDGTTDDTVAISDAISHQSSAGGGVVHVPNGTYMIKADVPGAQGNFLGDEGGVELRDNVTLFMSEGATLQAIPNAEAKYVILRCYNKSNVSIIGGTIRGDRYSHSGTTGEWGYGLAITAGSNITVQGTVFRDCWGDGINVQKHPTAGVTTNLSIDNVRSLNNRRQGMSLEGCRDVVVTRSTFANTNGTAPEAGVDIEPILAETPSENITFRSCIFSDNEAYGLIATKAGLDGLTVDDCLFTGNKSNQGQLVTYFASGGRNITFTGNTFVADGVDASSVFLEGGSDYFISGNTMDSSVTARWYIDGPRLSRLTFKDNTITVRADTPNRPYIFLIDHADNVTVEGNTIDSSATYDPTKSGVHTTEATNIKLRGNHIINVATSLFFDMNSSYVTATENAIDNAGIVSVLLNGASRVTLQGSTIAGSCHNSDGSALIRVNSSSPDFKVLNNTFIQGHRITTSGMGDHLPSVVFFSTDFCPNLLTRGNTLIKDPSSFTFKYVRDSAQVLTGGYIGDGIDGIMSGPTSFRPIRPPAGTLYYDTTIGRLVFYSGTDTTWFEIEISGGS